MKFAFGLKMDTLTINMKKIPLIVLGMSCIAFFFNSCYYDSKEELFGTTACDTVDVTYATTILPILETSCLECHSEANAGVLGGSQILEGYDFLMDYVVAGDANASSFYNTVAWVSGYVEMPQGSDQLSDCKIAKIRAWINAGALNN